MPRHFRRSTSALAVLVLLYETPMHPYRMRRLIKERGKDKVINIKQSASLYQTIRHLQRAELIKVKQTSRRQKHPERTIYELTEKGGRTLQEWMAEMISVPASEYPEFPAAVSMLAILTPENARKLLEERAAALAQLRDQITWGLQEAAQLPRLFLLEDEYRLAVLEAERRWVEALIDDLRVGRLTWSEAWVRSLLPPDTDA